MVKKVVYNLRLSVYPNIFRLDSSRNVKGQNWHRARIFIMDVFLTYLNVEHEWK